MHFHLPKPLHGWREFLGEVGIIVIGVSIALAAEQTIEWLHWQERTELAREGIRSELTQNYFRAAERIVVTPCLKAQLDRLQAIVLGSGDRLDPAPLYPSGLGPVTYRHPTRPWGDVIWQSVVTEQVSSHLGASEREDLARIYRAIDQLREANAREDEDDGTLQMLGSPVPLDAGLRGHILEAIYKERWRVLYLDLVARQMSDRMRLLDPEIGQGAGIAEWRHNMRGPDTTFSWCRAQRLPLAPRL